MLLYHHLTMYAYDKNHAYPLPPPALTKAKETSDITAKKN